jgi:hypothetical protein
MATIEAAQRELRSRYLELPVLIALALAGGAIAVGVVRLKGFGPAAFSQSGQFRLWLFLIAVQTALWAIAAAALLTPTVLTTLRGVWSEARVAVVASVVGAAIPLFGFVVYVTLHSPISSNPLPAHRWKLFGLEALGTTIALIGVAHLALVRAALQNQATRGTLADFARYLELRSLLQRVLAIEGAILGAAVLAAGALRNAVIAYTHHQASYPREYVFIVGIYFTLVLAMLYAPVYRKLLEVGRANLDAACPPVEPASPEWLAAHDKREKLNQHLQLEVTTSASFRAGIAILAPLGSALVALLLGTH